MIKPLFYLKRLNVLLLSALTLIAPPQLAYADGDKPAKASKGNKKKKKGDKGKRVRNKKKIAFVSPAASDIESKIQKQKAKKIKITHRTENTKATEDLLNLVQNGTDDVDAARKLIAEGANVNAQLHTGDSLLWYATMYGKNKIGAVLIAAGADVDAANETAKQTPLQRAIKARNTEMISLLLDAGADTNKEDIDGDGAASYAGQYGVSVDTWQKLLDAGADINGVLKTPQVRETKPSPLMWSVIKGNVESIAFLLKNGANPNSVCGIPPDEETPLSVAIQKKDIAITKLLLAAGAETNTLSPAMKQQMQELMNSAPRTVNKSDEN